MLNSSVNSLPDNQANTEDVSSWLPDPTLQSIVAKALGIEVSEITKEKSVKCRQSIFIRLIQLLLICPVWSMPQACLPFYMNGTNQISDFSVLTKIDSLVYAYLMGAIFTDDNVPDFGDNLTRLNLSSANVTDAVYRRYLK